MQILNWHSAWLPFPLSTTIALKSRTNISSRFVRDLTTKVRDLTAA
jgi:hypothetical protein